MDNETIQQLLLLLLLNRQRKNIRSRRWWVRPINLNRERRGEFRRVMLELKLHDEEWFFTYTRMNPSLFDELLTLVAPHLKKNSIRKAISPTQRLLITLRFLATGDSYFTIAQSYHIGKSTVCVILQEVTSILWHVLKAVVMPNPTEEYYKKVAEDFLHYWNLPHCIGSIDGKHVRIMAPAKSGSLYYNYKNYFSIILMGVCDAQYNFSYVDIGCYGSVSDGGVFANSTFGNQLFQKSLPFPAEERLPGSNNNMTYFFAGDAAFPLHVHLMRPYSGKHLNIIKAVFNYRLSRGRRVIENTFGVLAARWRIYHRAICASPEHIENIIKATIVLHNYIRASLVTRERYCPSNYVDNNDVLGKWRQEVETCTLDPSFRLGSNNASNLAISKETP